MADTLGNMIQTLGEIAIGGVFGWAFWAVIYRWAAHHNYVLETLSERIARLAD